MEDKRRTDIDQTIEYYDKNAAEFIGSTIDADVSELYKLFEELLSPGCRILDVGCGSGRDSKYFAEKSYDVVAIDPSAAMCEYARKLAHVLVYEMRAEDIQFSNEFDAVWACASLLHVPRTEQENVLNKIANSLKTGGVLYATWKYGDSDRLVDGRRFTDWNEIQLRNILNNIVTLKEIRIWITEDVRANRSGQKWLNALVRKT